MTYFIAQEYDPFILNKKSNAPAEIDFCSETHSYFVNPGGLLGKVETPSASHIITSVFGNKFINVKPEVLLRACTRGTTVHDEILNFIVKGEFGFTPEFRAAALEIKALMEASPDKIASEQILYCNNPFANFCCMVDSWWVCRKHLVDYKTSNRLDKASVTRQLNIYAYALESNGYKVNSLEAWHLSEKGLRKYPIFLKDKSYVECILRAYSEGLQFKNDEEMLEHFNKGEKNANQERGSWSEIYY